MVIALEKLDSFPDGSEGRKLLTRQEVQAPANPIRDRNFSISGRFMNLISSSTN
jgi:hypothetical protein